MMIIDPKYRIGQIVYLKTDEDQRERMVYCYRVYLNDLVYELTCSTSTSIHYGFEINGEKDIVKSTTN